MSGVPEKRLRIWLEPVIMNLAFVNSQSLSKYSFIVNLNIDTLFVDKGALRV